ncbi:hypothetical protein O1611_g9924 [Lasiodiplodia mahajangana]|uniref:Uncharacterized protein n=1 Tax=Lasiodiplodia mahajangana TaxID=1108764 RepID=A0ACC2J3R8_9PEZI|nr:hypothetical protein O1611_g9924 [Lasiodiplodia mahajangana]
MAHPTINSAGVISADGHTRVHVGDSHVTINNYPPANSHLSEIDTAKLRTQFLKQLHTSPYEDRKNRNPERAEGTCEWFTSHHRFQNWCNETSALLWVSADPGCGKSVLARYLIDDIVPSSSTRTTCYFFFKDDFDDQRGLESAFCCILHQLFTQKPTLLSNEILEDFAEEGGQLIASFSKLWSLLITATKDYSHGGIVCILDALDECVGQKPLAEALATYYSKGKGTSPLKFLVTGRPYRQIQQVFQDLIESHPTIHLSGESEEEVDKIAQEITIAINQRIEELCKRLQLTVDEKQILYDELATGGHRTYLWVYLVFDVIEEAAFLSKDDLRATIRKLPRTVEEAYENILRKSRDPEKTRKILHVVVAADRPLKLKEMAVVLAFRDSHRNHDGLEADLLLPDRLRIAIRENCGLFVVVQASQIFLLHQTAREFLVQPPTESPSIHSASLKWQHSLNLKESHRLLSEICIKYLLLREFKELAGPQYGMKLDRGHKFVFLTYAANNWADHFRQAHNTHGTDLECMAMELCDTGSQACLTWLVIYGEDRVPNSWFVEELTTPLSIASYFGLENLVYLILRDKKTRLNVGFSRTPLSWASEKGYDLIVQYLLDRVPRHQVILRDSLSILRDGLSLSPTIVNRKDKSGKSPLWYSAANGHQGIVRKLLKRGARINSRDDNGLTALSLATYHGHSEIVALLLKNGARRNSKSNHLETRNRHGRTLLMEAARDGDEVVVQLLLEGKADANALDKNGCTALMYAAPEGH